MDIKIAASILNADPINLEDEIIKVQESIDWIHFDVMDNHFVPNLSFGKSLLEALSRKRIKPLDAHLMIENPDLWACNFADAGADSVTFHLEAAKDPQKIIKDIHKLNKRVGVAIKPRTTYDQVKELLPLIDVLLVMTVEPGFGGQKFMDDMLLKVEQARKDITKSDLDVWIQVDGGVGFQTIEKATQAGADFLVVGSAAFAASEPEKVMKQLRNLAIASAK
ncbi:MAG: ribulose-phosphate 3-epimerase [Actinomycetota bacterium]|jgi:ribulose-phosphate 3-epimerase